MRNCPPGYFCEAGTENYLSSPCSAGTYRAAPGGTAQGSCDNCPAGHYCLKESAEPIACPAGTYRDTTGGDAADTSKGTSNPCLTCTAGSYCPHRGMTAAYPCGEGFYSQAGAQSCTLCQAGYKCSGTTQAASAYELDSNKCGGSKCEIWTASTHSIYQTAVCDAGHYCPTDSLLMIPCPRGTYRDLADNTPA